MKFEVIESIGEWIVRRNGEELARFGGQLEALDHVADRLRDVNQDQLSYSLAMRYQDRG